MFMGDYNMKLTLGKLRDLVKQVVKENRMVIAEEEIGMTFEEFRQILSGDVKLKPGTKPSGAMHKGGVQRLGIMTAENPRGVGADDQMNVELMKDFGKVLDEKGLQYVSIGGKYGNPENSYIIINPTMLDMVEFGKRYGQAVVIFAQKMRRYTDEPSQNIHFRFDYVQTEPDGLDEPQFGPQEYYVKRSQDMIAITDDDDNYSILDGTKFSIPFFGSKKMPKERYTTAIDPKSELSALKGKYDPV